MQKVSNRKCIGRLSFKTLKTAKVRNIIAIFAIMLTTILFSSVFTIVMSLNKTFQERDFRQVGGIFHGGFKNISLEELEELKDDPMIRSSATRFFVGMPIEEPFLKDYTEVSYMDDAYNKGSFCTPTKGRLPQEGTMEAAADTRVLELLGVELELGKEFTLTYQIGENVNPVSITDTFILSGWWEHDPVSMANNIVVPLSYGMDVTAGHTGLSGTDPTGTWSLQVMLNNELNIRQDLMTILENHGYQTEHEGEDNYIGIGVNWGYTSSKFMQNMGIETVVGMIGAVILIIFSGFLIINNIFRISISNDIRFYGLLKTIGTTGKQIKHIVRRQIIVLSAIGIPLGLIIGWFAGAWLTPIIYKSITLNEMSAMSVHPLIFVIAALLSFITVLLSCNKPVKIAAKVSPVEAVRYTERLTVKKKEKRGERGGNLFKMALSNLGRSKSKTILVILSLSLSVFLLNMTYTFTSGFSMEKYLDWRMSVDFTYGHANYFTNNGSGDSVSEEMIAQISQQQGITGQGRIYLIRGMAKCFITEQSARDDYFNSSFSEEDMVKYLEYNRAENGLIEKDIMLYGMDEFPLSKLDTVEGDLSKLSEEGQIAAILYLNDYGNAVESSNPYQVGDEIEILFVDEFEMVDSETGEPVTDSMDPMKDYIFRYIKTHTEVYTVCARVTIGNSMSARRYGPIQMILPSTEFVEVTGTDYIMSYLFDTTEESSIEIEEFLKGYTENVETQYDYESKLLYMDEFKGVQNMVLLMGGMLSLIIGIIGILNFINAIVTSVISRKLEFAILQAVGMTGKQMKTMLIVEGCLYGIFAILVALFLNMLLSPTLSGFIGNMFWFYSEKFTIIPILIVLPIFLAFGAAIPLISHHVMKKQTLVERIRTGEM